MSTVPSREETSASVAKSESIVASELLTIDSTRTIEYETSEGSGLVINAYNCGLRIVPPSFFNNEATIELHLDHNSLSFLPREIGCFSMLRSLSLHDNQLTCIPESIGELRTLKQLRLDRNLLTFLPDSIVGCVSLQLLHSDGNLDLASLPANLGDLLELSDLGIGNCPALKCLPLSLGQLENVSIWICDPSFIVSSVILFPKSLKI